MTIAITVTAKIITMFAGYLQPSLLTATGPREIPTTTTTTTRTTTKMMTTIVPRYHEGLVGVKPFNFFARGCISFSRAYPTTSNENDAN